MTTDWTSLILDYQSPDIAWNKIFSSLLLIAKHSSSPKSLHDATVVPDRLLTEAAWELWEAFPEHAASTSKALKEWTNTGSGKAVLILDAFSLRELPIFLKNAEVRDIQGIKVKVTGSECPSTTEQFAKALGLPSRSSLAYDRKPKTFSLFGGNCFTDTISIPFEEYTVKPVPNVVVWHSWLDDIIHRQKSPTQVFNTVSKGLQGDEFWSFINKLRQGRNLVVTSDHGYAVSKSFSSEIIDKEAIEILKKTLGASRNKQVSDPVEKYFMPPILMSHQRQCVVMGQYKWAAPGGFPDICHGGMSLLEVAVPYMELPAL
jgi:hypothetical protein